MLLVLLEASLAVESDPDHQAIRRGRGPQQRRARFSRDAFARVISRRNLRSHHIRRRNRPLLRYHPSTLYRILHAQLQCRYQKFDSA